MLTGLEALEDHCEPETPHSACRAAFAVVSQQHQSVAPQTSTCSCRKAPVQKLDTFHNEYLSAFYSQSRWLQNFHPPYFYFFFIGFYFFLQGLKNVLLSTLKTVSSKKKENIDGGRKKKSAVARTRMDPIPAAYKCTCPSTGCFSQRGAGLEGGQ